MSISTEALAGGRGPLPRPPSQECGAPGGVRPAYAGRQYPHRAASSRPFPLIWAGGKGNRLTDIDGTEYLDLLGEYTAGLYGHSDPVIQAAQKKAIDDGTVLGGPNQYEARLAAAIRARFPSVELIRFTNSGTEANLLALSAVRALDRDRPRVMAFEHGYHGSVFYFSTRRTTAQHAASPWVVGDYNDVEGTRALLRRHAQRAGRGHRRAHAGRRRLHPRHAGIPRACCARNARSSASS